MEYYTINDLAEMLNAIAAVLAAPVGGILPGLLLAWIGVSSRKAAWFLYIALIFAILCEVFASLMVITGDWWERREMQLFAMCWLIKAGTGYLTYTKVRAYIENSQADTEESDDKVA